MRIVNNTFCNSVESSVSKDYVISTVECNGRTTDSMKKSSIILTHMLHETVEID